MMYDTRYLPENFEQCRLEKTILRRVPAEMPSFKMVEKITKRLMLFCPCQHGAIETIVFYLEAAWNRD